MAVGQMEAEVKLAAARLMLGIMAQPCPMPQLDPEELETQTVCKLLKAGRDAREICAALDWHPDRLLPVLVRIARS